MGRASLLSPAAGTSAGSSQLNPWSIGTRRSYARPMLQREESVERVNGVSIFDPALYESTLRPLGEAQCLPAWCFTSSQWFEREVTDVFAPSWVLVGRSDEIGRPGKYLTIKVPGIGPTLVIRGKDGKARAFANFCRHRGATLLSDPEGQLRSGAITCPYHAWAYDTTGALRKAPKMCKETFNKDEFPLIEFELEERFGFLFANGGQGNQHYESLDESLGNLPETVFSQFPDLENYVTVARRDYLCDANWKFLFEK